MIPACGVALASFVFAYAGADTGYTVNLKSVQGEWIFSRDRTETVTVAGPLGDTVIAIQNGAARFLASPCAGQTCVAAGTIHSRGQWAACLPNKVLVFIGEGSGGAGPAEKSANRDETGVDAAVW